MSSQRRAGQGFANAAALLSDGARGGWPFGGGKANQPPAGDTPREDGWLMAGWR
jgi:hypothetical protein